MIEQIVLLGILNLYIVGLVQEGSVSGSFSGTIDVSDGEASSQVSVIADANSLEWGALITGADGTPPTAGSSSFLEGISTAGQYLFGTISWDDQSNWKTASSWPGSISFSYGTGTPTDFALLNQSLGFSTGGTSVGSSGTDTSETTGLNPDLISGSLLLSTISGTPVDLSQGLRLTGVYFGSDSTERPGAGALASILGPSVGGAGSRESGVPPSGVQGAVPAVPLPSGVWLLLGGFSCLMAFGRRANKTA